MNHHFQFLKREVGRHAKSVVLKETQKISKNQFAVHNSISYFSEQFLNHIK